MDKLTGKLTAVQGLSATLSNNINIRVQTKTIAPTDEAQVVVPDAGYVGLAQVVVSAVPNTYGHISWDGATLSVY